MQTFLDTEDKRADSLMRIDALNAEFNAIMDDPKARRKSKARLAEIRSDWDAALAELRVTPAVRRPVDPGSSPDTPEIPLYESYAGEVSARTVEKRRSMTPEERRARPPWYDFDVPEGEQIVRFANGGSAASVDDTSGPVMASFAGRASKRTTKSTGAPSLDAVITDLKNALGLNITQGLWGLTVRQGDRQVKLRPRKNVVGQFRRDSGVMSVRQSRDLTAIAHEGGHGLEMLLGTDLDGMKSRHFRELLSPVLPDRPAPTLAPGSGYSGVELDSEEQQRLVEATVAAIVWRDKQASPDYVKPEAGWFGLTPADPDETRATQGEAALAELVVGKRELRIRATCYGAPDADDADPSPAEWVGMLQDAAASPAARERLRGQGLVITRVDAV
jgi:hypothetical protein